MAVKWLCVSIYTLKLQKILSAVSTNEHEVQRFN